MRRPLRRPTIRDVAELAGVSPGTASKALSGAARLRPETTERVRRAADELDFRRNDLMLSLQRGRTYTVGFVTRDLDGRFTMPILSGLESVLDGAGYLTYIARLTGVPAQEDRVIKALLAKQIDGLIFGRVRIDPGPPIDVGKFHVPIVYANAQVTDPSAFSIIPDDAQGAREGVEHLVGMGRREIAIIGGFEDWVATGLRTGEAIAVLREHGLTVRPSRITYGDWSEDYGYHTIRRLLADDPGIDGVFCGSDHIARGVVDALRTDGYGIPGDVAVVGFDNYPGMSAYSHPPITSVDLNMETVGRLAAENLLAMIGGEHRAGPFRIPCTLVPRESTVGAVARR
ncbi:MAG TPA: LacI family DNA-binding transcriptional regulator [Thermomicrobiales bacterium]|nr:LacI family DNA-binding transcriptional regulator [Thermomicrobiales bacterium]